jgi:uncharacterized protein YndB with AHSA1/START domain
MKTTIYTLILTASLTLVGNAQKMQTMETTDFTTSFEVSQTPEQVFDAITNVRGWWSEEIRGNTRYLNDEFIYSYKDVHMSKMKLIEVVPNKKVVWQVMENQISFVKDQSEWVGNKVVFEITPKGNKTELKFTQIGLVPAYECYDICKVAWTNFINVSLKNLIENGNGVPNPTGKNNEFNEQNLRDHNIAR